MKATEKKSTFKNLNPSEMNNVKGGANGKKVVIVVLIDNAAHYIVIS